MRARRLVTHAVALAGLVVLVVAVQLVVVLWIGDVPSSEQRSLLVASAIAAAVTAVLYVPLRERLSAFAARFLRGPRDSPANLLSAFGNRLARPLPLDELLLQVAETLRRTLALECAEVWTGSAGILELAASDPDAGSATLILNPQEEAIVARAGAGGRAWVGTWLPQLLADRSEGELRVVPATHAGELLGLLVVQRPAAGRPFTHEDADVLLVLARQIGLALHNVRLGSALQASLHELRHQADELRASRARVVAAADAERRRIERDLHDGAQQQLYALAVNVRLARELAVSDPQRARAVLEELATEVERSFDQFRDLARGIYPPLLTDCGLGEALRAAVARAPVPAALQVDVDRRYPGDVEATVYFCCIEALQNAGRHAGEGAHAKVRVWEQDGRVLFDVADDGVGFDPSSRAHGAGLTNLGDRLGALGGQFELRSAPGRGTTVGGWIPLER